MWSSKYIETKLLSLPNAGEISPSRFNPERFLQKIKKKKQKKKKKKKQKKKKKKKEREREREWKERSIIESHILLKNKKSRTYSATTL